MALTQSELNKISKIEKEIEDKKNLLEEIKLKSSNQISKLALKYNLYKLDGKMSDTLG